MEGCWLGRGGRSLSVTRSELDPVEPRDLRERISRDASTLVVDVRSAEEFAAGHVEGAVNISSDQLAERLAKVAKDAEIVTVCNLGGSRSCAAAADLRALRYTDARPLRGGLKGWNGQS